MYPADSDTYRASLQKYTPKYTKSIPQRKPKQRPSEDRPRDWRTPGAKPRFGARDACLDFADQH